MNKKIMMLVFVFLLIVAFSGCTQELPPAVDDEMFTEGLALMEKAIDNVEIPGYTIDKNTGFFKKYKGYELNDMQRTYYKYMVELADNYNKLKATGDDSYMSKCSESINKITNLIKANTKKE